SLLVIVLYFTYPSTTASSTLSLHDALPISLLVPPELDRPGPAVRDARATQHDIPHAFVVRLRPPGLRPATRPGPEQPRRPLVQRSEEHTSELQSRGHLVCRLLLEKKKTINLTRYFHSSEGLPLSALPRHYYTVCLAPAHAACSPLPPSTTR